MRNDDEEPYDDYLHKMDKLLVLQKVLEDEVAVRGVAFNWSEWEITLLRIRYAD